MLRLLVLKRLVRQRVALTLLCAFAALPARADDGKLVSDSAEFVPLKYHQAQLVTDLAVGLWAIPIPLDYDGDGDLDLVVSTSNKASAGLYLFENPGAPGNSQPKLPVFKAARRIGDPHGNLMATTHQGQPVICTPGRWHPDFLQQRLAGGTPLPFKPNFHVGRANQWQRFDYDADGVADLVIGVSDWRDYGWDDAYNADGKWKNGPIHGYVYFIKNLGTDNEPKYAQPRQLECEGGLVDVFGCPSPNFADWDGDGDLDLLCGSFLDDFTFFQNVGTRAEPRYAAGKKLKHQGQTIRMDLQMLRATACDWDADGDADLIVGQEDGRVAFLECTGFDQQAAVPRFELPVFFQQQADQVKVGILNTPSAVDWDGDGDADLISGDSAGYLHFIENLGGNPTRWGLPSMLAAGGQRIRIQAGENGSIQGPAEAKWGYTVPAAGDFNGDGLPDIVINSIWGEVLWYRNIGTRGEPKLAAAAPVTVAWPAGQPPSKPAWNWWNPRGNALVTQWRTSPLLHDFDGDGRPDLIMLDHEGYLALYQRNDPQTAGPMLQPPRRIFKDAAGQPLRLNELTAGKSGRRKLALVDWDNDGRLDLLINGKNADFWRNIGQGDDWKFENQGPVASQNLAGHTTCPTLIDLNGDGQLELLLGTEDGFFYHLPQKRPASSSK